jgi:hypothetical protein
VLLAFALVFTATAGGAPKKAPAAPTGLHAFVYRADEPVKADHTYALMPAFAWNAVPGAASYDLQLASSSVFSDATTLYDKSFSAPVASVQLQVPWMTGKPYALWARVRVVKDGTTSGWSAPFGFNTAWQQVPEKLTAPNGLIRWSTVQGATGYEVWFQNVPGGWQTHFTTLTNVADEREYWTYHPGAAGTIRWRVRAVRVVSSGSLPNGIPVVKYGPYSKTYTSSATGSYASGKLQAIAATADVDSTPSVTRAAQLTPGFAWTGQADAFGVGAGAQYWRVYVFSDKQCVNPVMTGSIVGSPAWAPRETDPLNLPATDTDLADFANGKFPGYGAQNATFTADASTPSPSESAPAADGSSSGSSSPATPPASAPTAPPTGSSSGTTATRNVSLPDNGWPQGRYWWTVVPVAAVPVASSGGSSSSSSSSTPTSTKLEWHDLSLPQDLCAAGQVWPFGVQSAPVTTSSGTPFASGVGATQRVTSAAARRPSFRELPVITWQPAMAAYSYEIELSRHAYPWVAAKKLTSVVTSVVLPLSKSDRGVWYYRVRGVNPNLSGPAQKLAWSTPVAIKITGDIFKIVK